MASANPLVLKAVPELCQQNDQPLGFVMDFLFGQACSYQPPVDFGNRQLQQHCSDSANHCSVHYTAILTGYLGGQGVLLCVAGCPTQEIDLGADPEEVSQLVTRLTGLLGEEGASQKIIDTLKTEGPVIGEEGTSAGIREVAGDVSDAKSFLDALRPIGSPYPGKYPGEAFNLPGGGFVGFRIADSGIPTIDLNLEGDVQVKLKFLG